MSPPPDAADLVGRIETLVRELSRLIEDTDLLPQAPRRCDR